MEKKGRSLNHHLIAISGDGSCIQLLKLKRIMLPNLKEHTYPAIEALVIITYSTSAHFERFVF